MSAIDHELAPSGIPTVSIIVPARNEEASLASCLESIVTQDSIKFEVIVVDDDSTDRTRQIAQSFAGVQVVSPKKLLPRWSGKNNAVASGAELALGEWLLFTDADTVHLPGSLARAITEAEKDKASLLSYSPRQDVRGFWEKAVMPVIFAELASTFRPAEVSDPGSSAAAANGQYLLITREAYAAVGGHAAISSSLLEDVELARAVKRSGRKIMFRFGGDAVRTRMYRSFPQLRQGWTKNLVLLFPSPARLAALRSAEFVLIAGNLSAAAVFAANGNKQAALVTAIIFAVSGALFLRRILKAHFDWASNFLALLGLPLFSYLLLRSKICHARGSVSWKGRTYETEFSGKSEKNIEEGRNFGLSHTQG